MKLKKILKHLDYYYNVTIVEYKNDEETILFSGFRGDISKEIKNYYLDTNRWDEAICIEVPRNKEFKHSDCGFKIYVRKNKKND